MTTMLDITVTRDNGTVLSLSGEQSKVQVAVQDPYLLMIVGETTYLLPPNGFDLITQNQYEVPDVDVAEGEDG